MRALLYVVGILLPFAGGAAEVILGDTNNSPAETAAHAILVAAVAVAGYLLMLGGQYGRPRARGMWVAAGQVLAYLLGTGMLLLGTPLTTWNAHDLMAHAWGQGPDPSAHVTRRFFVEMLLLGPVLMCSGVAMLITGGRVRARKADAGNAQGGCPSAGTESLR
jgi:hypothetical protein